MNAARRTLAGTLLAMTALAIASCDDAPLVPAAPAGVMDVELHLSSAGQQPGGRVAVAVVVPDGDFTPAGLQGTLRFDPRSLRYAGQDSVGAALVMVGDRKAGEGVLRVLSLDLAGLHGRTAVLVFDVMRSGYAAALRYDFEAAGDRELHPLSHQGVVTARVADDLQVPARFSKLSADDWARALAPALGPLYPVPGQYVLGLKYGDANLSGSVNVLDYLGVANLAVGNQSLLTDATKDYVIAGNVFPFNLPGLGEDGDSLPPGSEANGSAAINVLDAMAIANEAVGSNQPVVGEQIPGREPRPTTRVVLHGLINANRTLYRDTIYQLDSLVIVPGGVTLTIQAGTTIEGDTLSGARLAIYRSGRLIARGTKLQPIVFTCTAAVKTRGCWGGLVVNGWSLLNNGEPDTGVVVRPCPEKIYPTTPGFAGGCLVQDTSGVLSYVRVEYAGHATPGHGPNAGLSLLGVGSGTEVESVQVYESLGDGLFVGGGTVDVRSIVLTDNAGDGLRWEDGWVGRGQFVIVQQSADGDHALHGINATGNSTAGPRSNPTLYNVTVLGPPGGSGAGGDGVRLEEGSALTLVNAIVQRAGVAGLDVDGTESCNQATGSMPGIHVQSSLFFGSPQDFSADSDCLDESAYALAPILANRLLDPQLLAPFNTLTPDLRPALASPAASGFAIPPANGFFDTSVMYVGAVQVSNTTGTVIPWYAGWTRGF